MLYSMLVNKHFQIWLLIGWQQAGSQSEEILEDFNKRYDGCNQRIKPSLIYLNPRASMLDHDFSTSSDVLMTTTLVNDMSNSAVS